MGDEDDESSRSSGEDCALPSSGDFDGGVVGEPDTASSDSSDASTSAESTPDEIYDASMEEVLEQGRQKSEQFADVICAGPLVESLVR